MKPTIEKMTKQANMLVKELIPHTMSEYLWGRDTAGAACCYGRSHTL